MAESSSKAVRDLIPEIIRISGRECVVRELSDISFLPELENKLKEELEEYLESKELEELADLLEVIYRISELRGLSKDGFEALRLRKKQEKGGFERNLFLLSPLKEKDSLSESYPANTSESRSDSFQARKCRSN